MPSPRPSVSNRRISHRTLRHPWPPCRLQILASLKRAGYAASLAADQCVPVLCLLVCIRTKTRACTQPKTHLRRTHSDVPVVAIITGCSTRGHSLREPGDVPFFKRGTFVRSSLSKLGEAFTYVFCVAAAVDLLHLKSTAFEYWVVLAVDDDDPFFSMHADDVAVFFHQRVAVPLSVCCNAWAVFWFCMD